MSHKGGKDADKSMRENRIVKDLPKFKSKIQAKYVLPPEFISTKPAVIEKFHDNWE
jgi:hypothetical protein